MAEQQRLMWNIIRFVGPVVIFIAFFFTLWKFDIFQKGTSFGIAAVLALADYFMLTWIMKRLGQ